MQISVNVSGELARFAKATARLQSQAATEMKRGLQAGGKIVLTDVRHALQAQTGVKRYGTIVKGVRWHQPDGLTFIIEASGKGLPIEEFNVKVNRSAAISARWSPRGHYKLQPRDGEGRFGKLQDPTNGKGAVTAMVWGVAHTFKRSFAGPKGLRAVLPGSRAQRKLFGPSLAKELPQGQSLAAFNAGAATHVLPRIVERLAKLMP